MKKLSLLLAALMILCCFALASCGETEESSAPAASSTAETSSEAPVSSEAEASSEDEASSEAESSEEEVTGPVVSEASMFWVTHFNDGTSEGAGAIFTESDTAGGWWIHVAFAPIAGAENAYEIVEITNGLADGSAAKVAVPEGGFVWASNYGNDYISLGMGDTDFTSPNCNAMVASAQLWRVGDKMQLTGLDLENLTVPTETADTMWYDDAYVCTATWAPIND